MLGITCSMIFEATVAVLTWAKTIRLLRRRRQMVNGVKQGVGYILWRDGMCIVYTQPVV